MLPVMASNGHKLQSTNKNTEHKKKHYKTTNKTCSFPSLFPVYHFPEGKFREISMPSMYLPHRRLYVYDVYTPCFKKKHPLILLAIS